MADVKLNFSGDNKVTKTYEDIKSKENSEDSFKMEAPVSLRNFRVYTSKVENSDQVIDASTQTVNDNMQKVIENVKVVSDGDDNTGVFKAKRLEINSEDAVTALNSVLSALEAQLQVDDSGSKTLFAKQDSDDEATASKKKELIQTLFYISQADNDDMAEGRYPERAKNILKLAMDKMSGFFKEDEKLAINQLLFSQGNGKVNALTSLIDENGIKKYRPDVTPRVVQKLSGSFGYAGEILATGLKDSIDKLLFTRTDYEEIDDENEKRELDRLYSTIAESYRDDITKILNSGVPTKIGDVKKDDMKTVMEGLSEQILAVFLAKTEDERKEKAIELYSTINEQSAGISDLKSLAKEARTISKAKLTKNTLVPMNISEELLDEKTKLIWLKGKLEQFNQLNDSKIDYESDINHTDSLEGKKDVQKAYDSIKDSQLFYLINEMKIEDVNKLLRKTKSGTALNAIEKEAWSSIKTELKASASKGFSGKAAEVEAKQRVIIKLLRELDKQKEAEHNDNKDTINAFKERLSNANKQGLSALEPTGDNGELKIEDIIKVIDSDELAANDEAYISKVKSDLAKLMGDEYPVLDFILEYGSEAAQAIKTSTASAYNKFRKKAKQKERTSDIINKVFIPTLRNAPLIGANITGAILDLTPANEDVSDILHDDLLDKTIGESGEFSKIKKKQLEILEKEKLLDSYNTSVIFPRKIDQVIDGEGDEAIKMSSLIKLFEGKKQNELNDICDKIDTAWKTLKKSDTSLRDGSWIEDLRQKPVGSNLGAKITNWEKAKSLATRIADMLNSSKVDSDLVQQTLAAIGIDNKSGITKDLSGKDLKKHIDKVKTYVSSIRRYAENTFSDANYQDHKSDTTSIENLENGDPFSSEIRHKFGLRNQAFVDGLMGSISDIVRLTSGPASKNNFLKGNFTQLREKLLEANTIDTTEDVVADRLKSQMTTMTTAAVDAQTSEDKIPA